MEITPVEAALRYARRGWPVFPCHHPSSTSGCSCGNDGCASPGKHPRTRRGLLDASTHRSVIERWWSTWPEANVAIRTGTQGRRGLGLLVLDVDPRHGGETSLVQLVDQHGPLPATRTADTGGGGRHMYFAHLGGGTIRNSASALGPGLDVRGDGGYVVAPPSAHGSGATYRWGPIRTLAPPPDWFVEMLASPEPQRPAPDPSRTRQDPGVSAWAAAAVAGELDRLASAEEGRRNHVLNRAAFVLGQIVGGGHLDTDSVRAVLEEAGMATGLGDRETRATVESGMRAGQRTPRHPPDRSPSGEQNHDDETSQAPEPVGRVASTGSGGVDLRTVDLPARSCLPAEAQGRSGAVGAEVGVWP